MDSILRGLNEAQKIAVTNPASVLLVLAPPGSGKTRTLTSRVGYLVANHGLKPQDIIVCTFTVKAAAEMRSRIAAFLGQKVSSRLILGTFHSICCRLLVKYGTKIGLPKKFGIADTSDTTAILTRIIKRLGFTIAPAKARSRISSLKSQGLTADQFGHISKNPDQKEVAKSQQEIAVVYSEYEEHLRVSNLLDFDDLLLRCVDLLRSHAYCVSNIQAVLVDEFQDTNTIQYDIMNLFAQRKQNITIVGDPDQSIYGWRDAEIRNLEKMQLQYPESCVVKLEENYRTSGAILLSAQEIIEQDTSRPAKRLMPTHSIGMRPVLRELPSATVEASWILSEINRTSNLSGGLLNYSDYAILLRSAFLSRQIESAFGKAGIPYRIVGGHKFFERLEVKLVLDYLRVISHTAHTDALARVLNVPPRRIGEVTIKNLLDESTRRKITLWECILAVAQGRFKMSRPIQPEAQKALEKFTSLILALRKRIREPSIDSTLNGFVTHLIQQICLEDHLKKTKPDDSDARWRNVQELITQTANFSDSLGNQELQDANTEQPLVDDSSGPTDLEETLQELTTEQNLLDNSSEKQDLEDALSKFLANVNLSTEAPKGEDNHQVTHQITISTIHAAKGLEWPIVFIPAAYNGSMPHSRSENTDEERRLLYVAMTRAQILLYLSFPTKDSYGGTATVSPFLAHRHLESFFDNRGPLLGCSIAEEFADTLGRPTPNKVAIQQALKAEPSMKNDQFVARGEDGDDESSGGMEYHGAVFRLPLKDGENRQYPSKSLHMTASTMQKNEYTLPSSKLGTSFMTATAFLATQKDNEEESKETSAPRPQKPTSARAPESRKRKVGHEGEGRPGQRNLNSYFGKRSG